MKTITDTSRPAVATAAATSSIRPAPVASSPVVCRGSGSRRSSVPASCKPHAEAATTPTLQPGAGESETITRPVRSTAATQSQGGA